MEITESQRQSLLNAARMVMRQSLRGGARVAVPPTSDPVLSMAAGCFVSLHERGSHRLRGCIGRLQTTDPLLKTIYETAESVLHDPRFRSNPITLAELPRLDLEVSVLSPLQEAGNPLDFDPPNDGIYLMCEGRTGTFLPQVARETGWTREQLLERLCSEKMGLSSSAWRSPAARLLKYTVVVLGPEPFEAAGGEAKQAGFGTDSAFRV